MQSHSTEGSAFSIFSLRGPHSARNTPESFSVPSQSPPLPPPPPHGYRSSVFATVVCILCKWTLVYISFLSHFIYFGCTGSSVLLQFLSSCSKQGLLFVVAWGLLTVVASPVGSTGSSVYELNGCGSWAQPLRHPGVAALQLVGIFPDQGSNPCFLHWEVDPLWLIHQASPMPILYFISGFFLSHNFENHPWCCICK